MRVRAVPLVVVSVVALAPPVGADEPRLRGLTCQFTTAQNWRENHTYGAGPMVGGPFVASDPDVRAVRVRCELFTTRAFPVFPGVVEQTTPGLVGAAVGPVSTAFHDGGWYELCTTVTLVYADRETVAYVSDPCPVSDYWTSPPPEYVER